MVEREEEGGEGEERGLRKGSSERIEIERRQKGIELTI